MASRWRPGARRRRTALGYAIAVLGAAAAAAVLLAFRGRVDQVIVVLAFLMVVVAAAATGGFVPGLVATALGFLAFDVLFIPPYRTLRVGRRDAYVSLAAYLLVTVVVSALVAARERRRREAERREQQALTLYTLSQSLVAPGDLDATLAGVARTVRELFHLAGCAVTLAEPPGPARLAASAGTLSAEAFRLAEAVVAAPDGQTGRAPHDGLGPDGLLALPMQAAGLTAGALVIRAGDGAPPLGEAERRVLVTFANQAAVVVLQARQEQDRARAQALEATDRLRTALLNSVSHDLRTPIAAIKASAASLLDEQIAWDERQRQEFLGTIEGEADRLARLVANLLDMSRIEAGAVNPQLADVWLPEVAGRAVRRVWAGAGPAIGVDVPESLPPVLADPVRLDQVLTNLLDNARRHGGDGPVELVGRAVEGMVEVRVVDHGPGVPEAEQELIFNEFYRVRRPGRREEGTGLGLSICRGLVEAMDGRLWAETAAGGGAAFVVRLPRADRRRRAEQET
ncbi:MAG TPA: ATP-binding protein [Actinomycetes bacterium]|jgi:two-component system sensor histidine kinase KdpD|nr:ATP-binding protein [Actinomycetes bacterium]